MIRLLDLPHHEARQRLDDGAIAWIAANPVEYHGPHLPLDTDRLQSLGWIEDLHRELGEPGEPLLAGDLPIGVDPTPGPGSRPVSFLRMLEALDQACRTVEEIGARRVVLVTFHGAPLHNLALHHAVLACRRRGVAACAPFQEVVRFLLEPLDREKARPAVAHLPAEAGDVVLDELSRDFHAGFFETSLMMHWAPAAVSPRHVELPPCPPVTPDRTATFVGRLAAAVGARGLAVDLGFAADALGWQALRPFPGYTGRPAHASAQAGAYLARMVLERSVPVLRRVLGGEEHPAPALAWMGPMTAWGRLAPPATVPEVTRL